MVRAAPGGTLLDVRAVTRASRSRLAGVRDGALLVQLAAAPVDGDANRALVDVLAESLDVARSAVTIRHGERGRRKAVHVAGLTPAEVRTRLGLAPS